MRGSRTRAGLASGLELILTGGLWTNVPITEPFARSSRYTLHRESGQYLLRHRGADPTSVALPPRPTWHEATTTSGKAMTRIGTLQGTYLGVYPAKVCEYWTAKPAKTNCKFCSVGLNLGVPEADAKSVDEVMEVVRAARRESGITYVDFKTGTTPATPTSTSSSPTSSGSRASWGSWSGSRPPPTATSGDTTPSGTWASNRVSFCFEIFDPVLLQGDLPGQARGVRSRLLPRGDTLPCMERGLPIGCAPNVHVSLVLLPEECRFLSPRRYPWQSLKLKAMAAAVRHRFEHPRGASPGPS